jgi:hypothetical protein
MSQQQFEAFKALMQPVIETLHKLASLRALETG